MTEQRDVTARGFSNENDPLKDISRAQREIPAGLGYDNERRLRILEMIDIEFGRAINRFASFNSGHEGKAVIEEELDELWEEVRANRPSAAPATREAIQIAAMAMRYVYDLSEWPDYREQEL